MKMKSAEILGIIIICCSASDGDTDIKEEWWENEDESLKSLINLGLTNNKEYNIEKFNIKKELYNLKISKNKLFIPDSTIGAKIDNTNNDPVIGTDHSLKFNSSKVYKTYIQQLNYEYSIAKLAKIKNDIIVKIITEYYDIVFSSRILELKRQALENEKKILEIIIQKHSLGMVNSNDLLTVQRRVYDTESGIFEYDKVLKQQNNNLRILLGVKYDYDIEMIDIDDIDIPQNEVYSIKTEYVKKNPDVILARLELLKAFKNIKNEERSWWPTISFNANTDVVKLNLGLGLSIDMPFLDWVNVHNRIKISKIEYEQKRLTLIAIMKKCINDMYYNIKIYEETNELLKNGPEEQLNETYDDVDIDTTTKLETENNRINEEIRLLQLKHDVVKARLVLQQLTN